MRIVLVGEDCVCDHFMVRTPDVPLCDVFVAFAAAELESGSRCKECDHCLLCHRHNGKETPR